MLEIINDVLSSEERAEKIVQEARDEAARKRNELSERETRLVHERQVAADRRLREALAEVRELEDKRRHEAEERLRRAEAEFIVSDPAGLDEAIRKSVDVIVRGPRASRTGTGAGGGAAK